jgi:beta-lactamase regulating signal transducer with metallopeptidase domain/HEAT repeat protein
VDVQSLAVILVVMKATVLLVAGAAVAAALRRAPAGARHLVWLATLAGVLVLPAMLRVAPVRLAVLPRLPQAAAMPEPAPAVAAAVAAVREARVPRVEAAGSPMLPPAGDWPRPSLRQALVAAWMAVAALLLARLAAAALAVRRIVRAARPLEDAGWSTVLCETADRLGLAELPALVRSDRVEMPFAAGVWRGTVVLPASADGWTDERRRLVLFHELAHMRRRDLIGHTLGRLACAAYWFHPLVWVAARRLRAESERACDDLVLACGTRPSEYAGHLLDIVAAVRHPGAPATAVAMARRKEFEGRMLAILDPLAARGTLGRARSAALLFGVGALFLAVAALAPSPAAATAAVQAPPPPAPDAVTPDGPRPVAAQTPARRPTAPQAAPRLAQAEDPDEDRDEDAAGDGPKVVDGERAATLARVLRTDEDASVRRAAAWALERSRDADAGQALVAALKADADDEVREMAAWALAHRRDEAASAALANVARSDRSDEVRNIATWALAQRRHADPAVFLAGLADTSPKVREVSIWALGNQRLDKAPPALVTALRDADSDVRLVAAWALGEIRDLSTGPQLLAAFRDEKESEVRQALFRALMLLGERTPELLEQALKSKDAELRQRAVQMLGGGVGAWPWPWPRPQPRPFP